MKDNNGNSTKPHTRQELILAAMNSKSRIHILHTLDSEGSLALSRLASLAGFASSENAGKFEFHVKKLSTSRLVELDGSNVCSITDTGRKALNFARQL